MITPKENKEFKGDFHNKENAPTLEQATQKRKKEREDRLRKKEQAATETKKE